MGNAERFPVADRGMRDSCGKGASIAFHGNPALEQELVLEWIQVSQIPAGCAVLGCSSFGHFGSGRAFMASGEPP